MANWDVALVVNLLGITVLLAAAALARRFIPWLRSLAVPNAIVAGTLGLALGPSVIDVLPMSADALELIVYHGFAVVFIAVGLQATPSGPRSGSARSLAVLVPTMSIAQVWVGLGLVALLNLAMDVPPAFGLLPMLGFSQGPGQAMSIGGSWESLGLPDGGQLGLVFAAVGFAFCCLLGGPLIIIGRRLGWTQTAGFGATTTTRTPAATDGPLRRMAPQGPPAQDPSGMDPLTMQLVAIGCVYIATFAALWGLTAAVSGNRALVATLWGFHFIMGALLAITTRWASGKLAIHTVFDDATLARVSVVAVDFTTTAALAAVSLGVLDRWLIPVAVLSLGTAAVTLMLTLWLSRRIFPDRPFEHAVAVFGTSTGTLPTGLALLRALDPDLRGPVARNLALGATGAIPLAAPLMLGIIPFSVGLWGEGLIVSLGLPAALLLVYLGGLGVAWKFLTPGRLLRPLGTLWPRD